MSSWAEEDEVPNTTTPSSIVEGDATAVIAQLEAERAATEAAAAQIDPDDRIDATDSLIDAVDAAQVTDYATGQQEIYRSAKSFAELGLSPKLLIGVKEMGWDTPSKIQGAALPLILEGRNVIAQGHHGSGKTGTFCLGILSQIDLAQHIPQAICLVNTRELAQQCLNVVYKLGLRSGAASYLAVGGGSETGIPVINQQIIVGTPGRIRALISKKAINPAHIKIFVCDEADTLLERPTDASTGGRGGRGGLRGGKNGPPQRSNSLAQQALEIQKLCTNAQILLFSATFSESVLSFAKEVCGTNAREIILKKNELALHNISQLHIDCPNAKSQDEKLDFIEDLLESNINFKQCIIFCNTINGTKLLTNSLREDGFPVSTLHSKLEPSQREQAAADFRLGKTKVLVSTNVLARGFDVPDVSVVINFDIPVQMDKTSGDCETYLHRIGRCGRFERRGVAISLTFDDASRASLASIIAEHSITIRKLNNDETETIFPLISKSL